MAFSVIASMQGPTPLQLFRAWRTVVHVARAQDLEEAKTTVRAGFIVVLHCCLKRILNKWSGAGPGGGQNHGGCGERGALEASHHTAGSLLIASQIIKGLKGK